jgi:hypothetical protein
MSGWLDLSQLGLAPNQKHQALLGAPKIVHCGEHGMTKVVRTTLTAFSLAILSVVTLCDERLLTVLVDQCYQLRIVHENVPQALTNLILNNGIAEQKDVETTVTHKHVLKEAGRVSSPANTV